MCGELCWGSKEMAWEPRCAHPSGHAQAEQLANMQRPGGWGSPNMPVG